ncbi:YuzL family protein [Peribacillus glennii]|uniref:YuzL family protein n=1 Tax=Peribacillus glennii TaxID=2303991 RepID=A0A372LCT0_9BACI|nr:YuzL family protein [Peribacillus glennii]RFU63815.1 YuzL family protein [Peribacillus glennii]
MAKVEKNPSKRGVSSASVKGNAGPGGEPSRINKVNSQNNQYPR